MRTVKRGAVTVNLGPRPLVQMGRNRIEPTELRHERADRGVRSRWIFIAGPVAEIVIDHDPDHYAVRIVWR
jgi:hemin uptake protein HemP